MMPLALACLLAGPAADLPAPIGAPFPALAIAEPLTGKPWSAAELPRDSKATVVVFTCTACPVAKSYWPRLVELSKRYADEGVNFVAVNSHPSDTPEDVAKLAAELKLPFPVVYDDGKLARQLAIDRVPTALVLDAGKIVRYKGRIDDQFAPGVARARPTTRELSTAIREVVAGRAVTRPDVAAAGCALDWDAKPAKPTGVTYHREVARVVQNHCQNCHRPGEAAPFALDTYKQAKSWSAMIREVVSEGVMPPWHADAKPGHFVNDRRLSAADKQALLDWIDADCPEGDAADHPAPKAQVNGWRLGREPDLIVSMKKPVTVPAQFMMGAVGMPYQYIPGDAEFPEDTWVTGVEVRADYRQAIHHIIVYTIPKGAKLRELARDDGFSRHMLAAYVPGDDATLYPAGLAKKIPAGASLLFEVHYTPNGKSGVDVSRVGLLTSKTPPRREVKSFAAAYPRLNIPAGEANYTATAKPFVFDEDVTLYAMTPHMHLRGKAFRYELVLPTGERETLLNVPHYDFNWQTAYELKAPRKLPKGSKIVCTAWYDNSTGNPANPDPTKTVKWGQQTYEEMMLGFFEYVGDGK